MVDASHHKQLSLANQWAAGHLCAKLGCGACRKRHPAHFIINSLGKGQRLLWKGKEPTSDADFNCFPDFASCLLQLFYFPKMAWVPPSVFPSAATAQHQAHGAHLPILQGAPHLRTLEWTHCSGKTWIPVCGVKRAWPDSIPRQGKFVKTFREAVCTGIWSTHYRQWQLCRWKILTYLQ